MAFRLPTLSLQRGATNSWLQVVVADLVVIAVCGAGLVFVDPGNGNYEPPGAWIWWLCLYLIVVLPPYLVITKALGRHPLWRFEMICLWVVFAVRCAVAEYQTYFYYLLSTW
jgi:hypothetical protein